MLFISGTKDKLFPIPGVEKAYKQMHDVWDELKVGQKLVTHIIDQPHECNLSNQAAILSFFNQYLK